MNILLITIVLNLCLAFNFPPIQDVGNVPFDINADCAIRNLAYKYSKQLFKDRNEMKDVFDGLELQSRCNNSEIRESEYVRPKPVLEGKEIYIDIKKGDNKNSGSIDSPLLDIEAGIRMCRSIGGGCSIILREGIYFINETIKLYGCDSNLSIIGYENEKVKVNGGKEIRDVKWELFDNEIIMYKDISVGSDLKIDAGKNSSGIEYKGIMNDVNECLKSCKNDKNCLSFIYYGNEISEYSKMCYLRSNIYISQKKSKGIISGIKKNIYRTYVKDINGSHFNQLFINNKRMTRARYPNGNAEYMGYWTKPSGLLSKGKWESKSDEDRSVEIIISEPKVSKSEYTDYSIGLNGPLNEFDPPQSYWGLKNPHAGGASTYTVPKGITVTDESFSMNKWNNSKSGILHAFHSGYWGNWMFEIDSYDYESKNIKFRRGGFQEARGRPSGGDYYIENIFEELDVPNEWYYDINTNYLYYYPNETIEEANTIIISQLDSLISIIGNKENPVYNITIDGIIFENTRSTYMENYLVPSGGDWSIHPGGTINARGVDGLVIRNNILENLGGNGIYISDYCRNVLILNNEIKKIGDSGIILYGKAYLNDGTRGEQPRNTKIIHNIIHDVGMYGKQTSAIFQAISCGTLIEENILFNGPRSGINLNDGFGGDNIIRRNLLFNWVRETSDHGPINSWDRMLILNDVYYKNHTASYNILKSEINRCFIINNYHSTWPLDHDDGSREYYDSYNFLIYGGFKNYLGHSNSACHNIYVYPDGYAYAKSSKSEEYFSRPYCISSSGGSINKSGYDEFWNNNTCIINNHKTYFLNFYGKEVDPNLYPNVDYNTIYCPEAEMSVSMNDKILTREEFEKYGSNKGTVVKDIKEINVDRIIEMGKEVLEMS